MHFTEVEVIASSEPWPFSNKDVSISYSESKQSRWVIFSDSLAKLLAEKETFKDIIGRMVHLKMVSHTMYQGKDEDGKDKRGPMLCWEVVGMDGASAGEEAKTSVSAEHQLILLLNGRTEQQFAKGLASKDDAGLYTLTEAGVLALQS